MPNLMPCPMPTCGAPIDAVHLVNQGMGGFTYIIRCDCGLTFDTGAQSEAAAADRWNERPATGDFDSEYPPCDFCGKPLAYEAWHSSGMHQGVMHRHLHSCDECRDARPAPAVAAPEGIGDRIEAAIKRVTTGQAPMRIPADATDVDLVLSECAGYFERLNGAQI